MKRKALSRATRIRIFDAHKGICCLCGQDIFSRRKEWIVEHIKPLWLGGEDAPSNMAPACLDCAVDKTCREATSRAKTDRQRANHLGIKKRSRPFPGGRGSRWKKKVDGTVVARPDRRRPDLKQEKDHVP